MAGLQPRRLYIPGVPQAVRYKMTLAYDGSGFHGWQKQHPPGEDPLRTVQQVVEDALVRLLGQPVRLLGASRTDAGVHAAGQVAQFDAATAIPLDRLKMAIRARLPEDVDVVAVEAAPPGFDAIADVTSKQYRYRIHNRESRPLWRRKHVYHNWVPLDVGRMNDAAARLVGERDVAAFANSRHGRESTVRTIHHCAVESHDEEVHVVVAGSGFLYHMVRIIAGTLLEVGRGRFEPEVVDKALASADRVDAGPTLPPEGLVLEWIRYGS